MTLERDRALALRRLQANAMMSQSGDWRMADLVGYQGATYVPGRGSLEPTVAFVIERPGQADATHRTPLRGRAGNIFNELLDYVGLDRRRVYVTHLVPWLPPNNRETLTQERDMCHPWLRRELRVVGSPPVVLLGRALSEYLTGKPYSETLARWVHSPTLNVPVLSVRHPAYGVYQQGNLPVMREQYRLILEAYRATV